ncbi:unnamed protein product [Meganyctiphanes norvegica]|uniref:Protein kinase domain-containing protein n=1 Tax=Meganyctiphanes norvegica TaxID=48144 RepID=A0AAV2R5R5_MEGNR
MVVWGVVLDDVPGNTFYLMDTPIATLDQIQRRLTACGCSVPEELVWCVVYQVSSALLYMLTRGLNYSPLALDNVFLLKDRLVLENMLSRKYRMAQCSCEMLRGRIRYRNSIPSEPNEHCFLHSIGHLIFALITCHLRSQPEGDSAPCSPINTLRSIKHLYSPELVRVLSCCLPGGITAAWSCLGGGAGGRVAERTQQWETTWDESLAQSQQEWPMADDEGYEIHDAVMADIWYPECYRNSYDYKWSNSSRNNSKKRRRSEVSDNSSDSSLLNNSNSMTEEERMNSSFSELLFKRKCKSNVLKNEYFSTEISKPLPIVCNDPSTVSLKMVVLIAAHEVEQQHHCRTMMEAVSSSSHRLIQHVMTVQKKFLSERRDSPPGYTSLKS